MNKREQHNRAENRDFIKRRNNLYLQIKDNKIPLAVMAKRLNEPYHLIYNLFHAVQFHRNLEFYQMLFDYVIDELLFMSTGLYKYSWRHYTETTIYSKF